MIYKVLSIRQPWAILFILKERLYETRSMKINYRGPLLIHASKNIDKEVCELEPFKSILAKHGYNKDNLPCGEIIGKCELTDCLKVDHDYPYFHNARLTNGKTISGNEYEFGNYMTGRYAWLLKNSSKLDKPIKINGHLSLWNYESEINDIRLL